MRAFYSVSLAGVVGVGFRYLQIEERPVVRTPADDGVVRAFDPLRQVAARRDVEHLQRALLGAAGRQPVRDVAAVPRRLVVVERVVRRRALAERRRVEQQVLLAVEPVAIDELRLLRARLDDLVEEALAAADHAAAPRVGVRQFVDAREQRIAAGDRIEHGPRRRGLRLHPGLDRRVLQVLEVAVRVDDRRAEIRVGDGMHRGDRWRVGRERCLRSGARGDEQDRSASGCDVHGVSPRGGSGESSVCPGGRARAARRTPPRPGRRGARGTARAPATGSPRDSRRRDRSSGPGPRAGGS